MKTQGTRGSENLEATNTLSIIYRSVDAIEENAQNPRIHSKNQISQIAESIKAFGLNVPILVDSKLRVIAGHGRVAACRLLGIERVPTISIRHLNETQVRAFTIADNRLTENSSWDAELLAQQLKMLSEVELNFNLEAVGFEMGEIDLMIEGLGPAGEEEETADISSRLSSTTLVSKCGDLWLLDRHRVICGNALHGETYSKLSNGDRASAVFSDPPYNLPIDGYVKRSGTAPHPEFAMASGELSSEEFIGFLSQSFKLQVQNTHPGALHFVCIDWRHCREILAAAEGVFDELKNICVWLKDSGGLGSLYRSQHELIFVYKSGAAKHRNNIQLGQFGRNRTNVWKYPRATSPSGRKEEPGVSLSHPTVKPVALVADAILDCTARGDIVLDPFLGSGTTLIAAERTGRCCHGIELEPRYIDAAIRRWQAFTGHAAVHASSGATFNQTEEEVAHG